MLFLVFLVNLSFRVCKGGVNPILWWCCLFKYSIVFDCSIRRPCCCSSSPTVFRGVQATNRNKMLAVNVSANIHMFTFVCVISTISTFLQYVPYQSHFVYISWQGKKAAKLATALQDCISKFVRVTLLAIFEDTSEQFPAICLVTKTAFLWLVVWKVSSHVFGDKKFSFNRTSGYL